MGIVKSFRKARAQKKIELKAAKARARQEAKSAAKMELKADKFLAKQEKKLLKEEKKGQKRKNKHELKLAKNELAQIKAGKFNAQNVARYSGALRAILPIALPLVYRGITMVRDSQANKQARAFGVSADELAKFAGYGAPLKARIAGMRETVNASSLPTGFIKDVEDRLRELSTAVDNAERMTTEKRQAAHRSITKDLDNLAQQIQDKISG